MSYTEVCPDCGGDGKDPADRRRICPRCDGECEIIVIEETAEPEENQSIWEHMMDL